MKHLFLNKILLTGMLSAAMAIGVNALTIDTTKVKAGFKAFKTAQKTGVDGTFDKIEFKFPKKTDSIVSALEGASATMEGVNVNLNDASRNATVKEAFFVLFKKDKQGKQLIKVTFRNVVLGNNQGTILANVSMNGRTQKIPMQFNIADGKLVAKGVLDVLDFGLSDAFKSLSTTCEALHEGVTWSQVEINFTAPIK